MTLAATTCAAMLAADADRTEQAPDRAHVLIIDGHAYRPVPSYPLDYAWRRGARATTSPSVTSISTTRTTFPRSSAASTPALPTGTESGRTNSRSSSATHYAASPVLPSTA